MTIGDLISKRYEIRQHIGRGGMQDVYLAFDNVLEINVALKTPQPGQPAKRFAQSAMLAARVNHHNVAKTFDYIDNNGTLFLIEEFVPGENLEVKLARFGAVDPHLGARVFHHLLQGVAAAHRAGVVHRDIKPSNVIVAPGVNLHLLKITDFGIATLTAEVFERAASDGDITRSASGSTRGALPYMAPELMFRKADERPGQASDIWSIGAMMFKVLTGEYPFGVFLEAAVNVKNRTRQPWPDFMTRNPQYAPLAKELQSIVDRCLEYEAPDRPSAEDLVNECSQLCHINLDRSEGAVGTFIQGGASGFAEGADGTTFFSMKSVYGARKPSKSSRLCYTRFPGDPRHRGHPIAVID